MPPQLGHRVVVAPGDDVIVEPILAQHLGQAALRPASEQLELDEPVLRHRVADAEPEVVIVARTHVRHAVGVARDRHARGGDSVVPGRLKPAGLKANDSKRETWSARCGFGGCPCCGTWPD